METERMICLASHSGGASYLTFLNLQNAAARVTTRAQSRQNLYVAISKAEWPGTIEVRRSRSPATKVSEHLGIVYKVR
jgi:hypothetical protein